MTTVVEFQSRDDIHRQHLANRLLGLLDGEEACVGLEALLAVTAGVIGQYAEETPDADAGEIASGFGAYLVSAVMEMMAREDGEDVG